MPIIIEIEDNSENYYESKVILTPTKRVSKINSAKGDKDSKLPAVEPTNPLLQADWSHRLTPEVINCSRVSLRAYTGEEIQLLKYFVLGTENSWVRNSTPNFTLVEGHYILPVDIWVQVRASCECLRSRVLPFITRISSDLEEDKRGVAV